MPSAAMICYISFDMEVTQLLRTYMFNKTTPKTTKFSKGSATKLHTWFDRRL